MPRVILWLVPAFLFAFNLHRTRADQPWALKPVMRPQVPRVRGDVQTPIDSFLLARLHEAGLAFAPPGDRATLIRRVTVDLLGLPPTPEEIDAFVADPAPDAYERLIDRLLSDPRYGERWARHWLDLARFAESQGFERDKIREYSWPYRDYVIRSFNADKPYSQFVREQIAGDVLPGVGRDGVIATGFLVAGPFDEAGSGSASAVLRARIREEELEDIVGTVGQTFLGLTINCARCHDHKFDPIPQRDYYRIKSVFDGVRHGERPIFSEDEKRQRSRELARIDAEIQRLGALRRALETKGRERLPRANAAAGAAIPIARWDFDGDARDAAGELHGKLHGGAHVARGRLVLNGTGAFVATRPVRTELRDKTLEAWVALPDLDQRGGGVISVQTIGGQYFDAIVFGERTPRRWIAGSDGFRRTRDLDAPNEQASADQLVHVAITYTGAGRIAVYRNGRPYGAAYQLAPQAFPSATSQILFGLRHTGAGNGFLRAEIEEARLYDRALAAEEIAVSFEAGPVGITRADILEALTPADRARWHGLEREIAGLRHQREQTPTLPTVYAATIRRPEPTAILLRGDVEKRGALVAAGGLAAVSSPPPDFGLTPDSPEAERRRRFADWVVHPQNPLTARVMVNRIWQHHFGHGIVDSPNDFGANGELPSHRELLDWLADEFGRSGGSVKSMHRLIMRSTAYRQSSRFDNQAASRDADSRLLWRYPPRRLEAEVIRDSMLAVSGQLNGAMNGPGFRPFKVTVFNSTFYDLIDDGRAEFNRRTIYRIHVNSAKDPLLESFDCPEPSVKTPRRSSTTTPIQALALMNGSFVQRQAKRFAQRITAESMGDAPKTVERAYRLAFGRLPTESERQRAINHATAHGWANLCWALLNSSEFLYVK